MSFRQIPIDEFWAFAFYYLPSVGCSVFITGVIWASLNYWKQKSAWHFNLVQAGCLLAAPVIIWIVYFAVTAKNAFAITSLDSENNVFAEKVYGTVFDVNLNNAEDLAIDDKQTGNVRFYASCRVADILSTNDDHTRQLVFQKVANASNFETGFGGTNSLTCGFFSPNYAEGPFTVGEIIQKRLRRGMLSSERD